MGQYWSHWSQALKVSAEELADLGVTKPKEVFKFLEGMIPRHNQIMETDYPRMYDYAVQAQAQMNSYQSSLAQSGMWDQFNPASLSGMLGGSYYNGTSGTASSSNIPPYMTYEDGKAYEAAQKAKAPKLDDPVQWLKGRVREVLWYPA